MKNMLVRTPITKEMFKSFPTTIQHMGIVDMYLLLFIANYGLLDTQYHLLHTLLMLQ